jgi:Domain of unknown function (DUF1996)
LAAAAAFFVAGSPAAGSSGWLIRSVDSGRSTMTHSLPDDPIEFPGQPDVSHLHDFFCNSSANAFSTYDSMLAGATVCPSGDSAGYWAPALYRNGVKVNPSGYPTRQQIYYRDNNVSSVYRVTPFPANFKMIIGNPHAATQVEANAIDPVSGIGAKIPSEQYWGCSNNSEPGKQPTPINCSTGIISLHVGFPNCWNGVRVEGNQVAAGTLRWPSSGSCPAGFGVVLPRLLERFEYPVGTSSSGITLASGNVFSVHADFWNTWNQASLETLTERCLNGNIDCGTNPVP